MQWHTGAFKAFYDVVVVVFRRFFFIWIPILIVIRTCCCWWRKVAQLRSELSVCPCSIWFDETIEIVVKENYASPRVSRLPLHDDKPRNSIFIFLSTALSLMLPFYYLRSNRIYNDCITKAMRMHMQKCVVHFHLIVRTLASIYNMCENS